MVQKYFPTVCGLWCDDCDHFEKDCQGCTEAGGCAFWTQYVDVDSCPVYTCCVQERGLPHCGYCEELPCERHTRFSDPDVSSKEREIELKQQVEELLRRKRETEA
jgi:hypothetical protein